MIQNTALRLDVFTAGAVEMFWADKLVRGLPGPQLVNDSKTPSGAAHVGALRGPVIHDVLFRVLKERDIPVRYLFGSDDLDPLDEIPFGESEHFAQYLGMPLCDVPAPLGSQADDMAEHFISDFWGIFRELDIQPEFYRMRDLYRSGKLNDAIDRILFQARTIREVYRRVSGSEKPASWHPFQVICDNCGRIGTTEVSSYNGSVVSYKCRPDLVPWAQGCGQTGTKSPFDGNGKLPWKLEWCAKWYFFDVTIEGAGRDHSTKGGSREVAAECLRKVFGRQPPLNCPYEFFTVGGAKMSSSKGVGVTARSMSDFLPPTVLRFLMIRTKPKNSVTFETSEAHVVKLFNDFDRLHREYFDERLTIAERRTYELSCLGRPANCWLPDFQLVVALLQLPHVDIRSELERRKGTPLTAIEEIQLDLRIRAAKYWLDNLSSEEERITLQTELPQSAYSLSHRERGFLRILRRVLEDTEWEATAIQGAIFRAARHTPIDQREAFQALYRVLLGRNSGPRGGNLLEALERGFVRGRLEELPFSKIKFWEETGISQEDFEGWVAENQQKIDGIRATLDFESTREQLVGHPVGNEYHEGIGVVEFALSLAGRQSVARRVIFERFKSVDVPIEDEVRHFEFYARDWLSELEERFGRRIETSLKGASE